MNRIFLWTFSLVLLALLAHGTFATEAAAQRGGAARAFFSYNPVSFGALPNTLSGYMVRTSGLCTIDLSSMIWLGAPDRDEAKLVWIHLVSKDGPARPEDNVPLWPIDGRMATFRSLCDATTELTLRGHYYSAASDLDYKGVLLVDYVDRAEQTNLRCGG